MSEKLNFASPLHLACAKDSLRPTMECVHFVNGFAYASDAHIVIKQSLEYSSVTEIEYLEGKSLHRDSFKDILGFDYATANEDGISCKDENGREAFFAYAQLNDKVPDFEAVLQKHSCKGVDFIGVAPKHFNVINKALIGADSYGVKIHFNGVNGGMLIEVLDYKDQVAMLMPMALEPTLF